MDLQMLLAQVAGVLPAFPIALQLGRIRNNFHDSAGQCQHVLLQDFQSNLLPLFATKLH